jgi:hypothetical protein
MLTRCLAILFVLTSTLCLAQRDGPAPANIHVLLIQGITRDPVDRATKDQALNALRAFLLERTRVDPGRLVVLTAHEGQPKEDGTQPTADNIRQTLDVFASRIQPQDRLICYYLGQANVVGGVLRLNLPGPDIAERELADWLRPIAAKRQVIVLDCPCAGLAAKTLTAEGRIVLCAATAKQVYATQFTAQLAQILSRPATDLDGDGKLSLLEAFTATARAIEESYRHQQILATETPCLEDDGDGAPSEQPWKYKTEKGDGANAAAFLLAEDH